MPANKAPRREQMQNARENPLAAAAAAAVAGAPAPAQPANEENLLDFDMDGTAPASGPKSPLEGLAESSQPSNLDDLMGLSEGMSTSSASQSMNNGHQDILGGYGSLDLGASRHPPLPGQQLATSQGTKNTNEDLLGLF